MENAETTLDDGLAVSSNVIDIPDETQSIDGGDVLEPERAPDIMDGVISETIFLAQFIRDFGAGMLEQVKAQTPPVYQPAIDCQTLLWQERDRMMQTLKRKPFKAQAEAVQAIVKLLADRNQPAAVLNAEMGTGKTMMAICAAALMQRTHPRTLIISPPHLVYKWRREILETVPNAKVWVLNGPDTLRKLLMIRHALGVKVDQPEFFVLGRVRMRMGFNWKPAFVTRHIRIDEIQTMAAAACPDCMKPLFLVNADGHETPVSQEMAAAMLGDRRLKCKHCGSPLWSLMRPGKPVQSLRELVGNALTQLPTIGPASSKRLLDTFGERLLSEMLEDNVYEFVNLMDAEGNLVFSDSVKLAK